MWLQDQVHFCIYRYMEEYMDAIQRMKPPLCYTLILIPLHYTMYHASSSVTDALRRRIAATHSVELTETGTIVEKKPRAELPDAGHSQRNTPGLLTQKVNQLHKKKF